MHLSQHIFSLHFSGWLQTNHGFQLQTPLFQISDHHKGRLSVSSEGFSVPGQFLQTSRGDIVCQVEGSQNVFGK